MIDQKERESIMDLIVEEGVFILDGGPFKTSGGLSVPFYLDFRRIASNPDALKKISKVFAERIKKNNIDVIGGIETAGIPFATALSLETGKDLVWFRKKVRDHGLPTIISGNMPDKEDAIAVVDDSVGGGDSVSITIENLEKEGYAITLFLSIMDGDIMNSLEERKKYFKEKGVQYFFICTWKEWVDYLVAKGKISKKVAEYSYEFIENPLSFDEEKLGRYEKDLKEGAIWIGEKT
jgi:orotate phosphoribosyltransferase